jgi:outer membrane biosynthesis protein TonB
VFRPRIANRGPVRTLAFCLSGAFALLSLVSAQASFARTSPAPQASAADPCATAVPELPNDLPTAFAHEIESPAILQFLATLAAVPARQQKSAFNRAADAANSPAEQTAAAALTALCPNLDEIYATTRALTLVANRWKLDDIHDEQRWTAFSHAVEAALWALSDSDELAPQTRQIALQPFPMLAAAADGSSPVPLPAASCSAPDAAAKPLHEVAPDYPPLASSAATSGEVNIVVSLSDNGDVRSARILANTLRRGLGTDAIIRAAIFAAAATTYTPGIKACRPVAGKFVMRYRFSLR